MFHFVEREKANHAVATMCRVLEVSTSAYYAWRRRAPSKRALANAALSERIRKIHRQSRGTYGAPRVHADLIACGVRCGRKRVARLMRQGGLEGVHRRRKPKTTRREPVAQAAKDLVNRNFTAEGPNQLWAADITYLPTDEGYLYLAAVIDAFSRRPVGWSMSTTLKTELVIDALEMAILRRRPGSGLIHHSDHGSQYTSLAFGRRCRRAGIVPSMGSVGDAYDNALIESFFATLECELIDRRRWRTRAEARMDVFDYLEVFYARRRRHSALAYLAPAEFERQHEQLNPSHA